MSPTARVLLAFCLVVATFLPTSAAAAPPRQYETVGGYFFGLGAADGGSGFGVSNADDVAFWSTFRGLGGAEVLGYPISRRFVWNGRTTQVFQRAVLQYEPLEKRVVPLNVLDLLHERGRDPWLQTVWSVPPAAAQDEQGKSWEEIVAGRQAWLEPHPPLRDAYFSVRNPIGVYGLPTSSVVDMGNHLAIRLQRGVLQLWKHDVPWAGAGQVTAALVGEIARDSGLFQTGPKDPSLELAFTPEVAPPPKPPPPPAEPAAPTIQRPATIPAGVRWIDINLSRQWLTAVQGNVPVYGAPVTTGKKGFVTPTGTFRIFSRVANETMDSATTGIPRDSAEGYFLKNIRWTQYFADGGYAIHTNYWQPDSVFGAYPTSHGCVGMREADARFVWGFATFGTPVYVHY